MNKSKISSLIDFLKTLNVEGKAIKLTKYIEEYVYDSGI